MNVEQLRKEFPLLSKPDAPIYLDSACMSLKPRSVIDAVVKYYEETPFCAGRGVYEGSLAVKTLVEDARRSLAEHLGARSSGTVFTKNATEAINLVAHSFPWKKGDVVLTTDREHNSNLVPWQRLRERGVRHEVVAPRRHDGPRSVARPSRAPRRALRGGRARLQPRWLRGTSRGARAACARGG
ncbi:MAG: aminotransferase class V-fold PLP-dependent enzyme [Candidatus Thermoplasmatota archaeon]